MIWVIENGINLDFISGCLNDENGFKIDIKILGLSYYGFWRLRFRVCRLIVIVI